MAANMNDKDHKGNSRSGVYKVMPFLGCQHSRFTAMFISVVAVALLMFAGGLVGFVFAHGIIMATSHDAPLMKRHQMMMNHVTVPIFNNITLPVTPTTKSTLTMTVATVITTGVSLITVTDAVGAVGGIETSTVTLSEIPPYPLNMTISSIPASLVSGGNMTTVDITNSGIDATTITLTSSVLVTKSSLSVETNSVSSTKVLTSSIPALSTNDMCDGAPIVTATETITVTVVPVPASDPTTVMTTVTTSSASTSTSSIITSTSISDVETTIETTEIQPATITVTEIPTVFETVSSGAVTTTIPNTLTVTKTIRQTTLVHNSDSLSSDLSSILMTTMTVTSTSTSTPGDITTPSAAAVRTITEYRTITLTDGHSTVITVQSTEVVPVSSSSSSASVVVPTLRDTTSETGSRITATVTLDDDVETVIISTASTAVETLILTLSNTNTETVFVSESITSTETTISSPLPSSSSSSSTGTTDTVFISESPSVETILESASPSVETIATTLIESLPVTSTKTLTFVSEDGRTQTLATATTIFQTTSAAKTVVFASTSTITVGSLSGSEVVFFTSAVDPVAISDISESVTTSSSSGSPMGQPTTIVLTNTVGVISTITVVEGGATQTRTVTIGQPDAPEVSSSMQSMPTTLTNYYTLKPATRTVTLDDRTKTVFGTVSGGSIGHNYTVTTLPTSSAPAVVVTAGAVSDEVGLSVKICLATLLGLTGAAFIML